MKNFVKILGTWGGPVLTILGMVIAWAEGQERENEIREIVDERISQYVDKEER